MSSNTEEEQQEMDTISDANKEGARDNRSSTEEVEPMNEGDDVPSAEDIQDSIPEYTTQKQEVHPLLSQRLNKQDEWYLLDQRWLKQWKKYTGFDSWDQVNAGNESYNPGPVDNSNLFKNVETDTLKDHLMEELDYALIPKPAWDKLSRWYGLTSGSRPICRKVVEYGTYVKHLKVEVYLFELKLCVHPHVNDIKSFRFSRANTIKDIEDKMREVFEISSDEDVRLWQRYMTNSYELLTNHTQTLADAGIYGGQLVMIEKKNSEGQWQRNSSTFSGASSSGGGSPHVTRSTTSYSSSYSSYYDRGKEPSTPGLCGLSNLGNTCFMNSALQCLSNTPPLTEYFIGNEKRDEKPYKKHINKDNPLGMGGALAETYGSLLEEMWCGQNSYLAPRQFKLMIGKHAPQFSGFQQHDSHELLAFLLDGLHEDLNLVRKKPYVDMDIKTEGRNDADIAEETWHKYLLRNQSVIVRVFQGQLKSTLDCPKCRKVSRIFDPFMYLSLPIPIAKTRDVYIYLVNKDPTACVTKYRLSVPKSGSIGDLKDSLNALTGIDPKSMVVIDVYHSRFHRVYYNKDPLSHIMDRDDIYVYELAYPMEHPDWVPVPVYMREIHYHKSYSYYGQKHTTSYGQVFGLPIVVTVPRQGCTYRCVYDTIMNNIKRYVRTRSDSNDTDGKGEEKEEGKNEASENNAEEMEVRTTVEAELIGDTTEALAEDEQNENNRRENEQNQQEQDQTENGADANQDSSDNDELSKDQPMETSEEEHEKKKTSTDLFRVSIVNSYGSQEVQKLSDEKDKLLKLTSQTYLGCEWDSDDKDAYYNVDASQAVLEHQTCLAVKEGKKLISIHDCMDLFVQKEVLGEEDAWYCPHCKEFVQASKKFDLWKMPEILVIHLKRFSYTRWYRNKIEARIDFPLEGLDLSNYVTNTDEAQPLYDLYAVDNHYGGLGGGHYTAYCKNKNTGKWYSFDDSHVSAVSGDESQICSSSSYLLFYRRRVEGKPVPGILDRSLSVSFEEEVGKGKRKFQREQSSKSLEMDSNKIAEEKEEREQEDEDGEGNIDDSAFVGEAV